MRTRHAGILETVRDGVEGLLVAPRDIEALAAALRRLAEDAVTRERFGRAARHRYETAYAPERLSRDLTPRSRGSAILADRDDEKMAPASNLTSVAAVILNWNQAEMTCECVASVLPEVDHIYVVDNGSQPANLELLDGLDGEKTTVLVNATNLGYAGGCNRGVFAAVDAGFDAVLIMNNDAFPDSGSVTHLLARLNADPELAAVGPVVVQSGTREVLHGACSLQMRTGRARWLQHGTPLSELGHHPTPTAYLSGEVMLVRTAVVRRLGMFDERYFCYYEDVEWGLRARQAGFTLEVVPTAVFEHVLGATSSGLIGVYYRARNLPLFLRMALGRTRLSALVISSPAELLLVVSLARRGRFSLILRGVLRGWLAGLAL